MCSDAFIGVAECVDITAAWAVVLDGLGGTDLMMVAGPGQDAGMVGWAMVAAVVGFAALVLLIWLVGG